MLKNVYLIGMPGCGKSTIGRAVGEVLNRTFVDMDDVIERTSDQSISALFDVSESHFRKAETAVLEDLSKSTSLLIATGGGVVTQAVNVKLLRKSGFVIYIQRAVDDIFSDIDVATRPLLAKNPNGLMALYEERKDLYETCAHLVVRNDGDIWRVVDAVVKEIEIYENYGN